MNWKTSPASGVPVWMCVKCTWQRAPPSWKYYINCPVCIIMLWYLPSLSLIRPLVIIFIWLQTLVSFHFFLFFHSSFPNIRGQQVSTSYVWSHHLWHHEKNLTNLFLGWLSILIIVSLFSGQNDPAGSLNNLFSLVYFSHTGIVCATYKPSKKVRDLMFIDLSISIVCVCVHSVSALVPQTNSSAALACTKYQFMHNAVTFVHLKGRIKLMKIIFSRSDIAPCFVCLARWHNTRSYRWFHIIPSINKVTWQVLQQCTTKSRKEEGCQQVNTLCCSAWMARTMNPDEQRWV